MNLCLLISVLTVCLTQSYAQTCPSIQIVCDPFSKYSRIDGACNNLRTTWLGKASSPYKRYLRAEYQDGVNAPRSLSVTGRPLPNARL